MPTKAEARITQWSFSRWKDHEQCPQLVKFKHIDRVKLKDETKSPALLRGEVIHKEAEDYVKGIIRTVPKSLKLFGAEFRALRAAQAIAEGKWAMTVNWTPTEFFAHNVWCRVVLDAHHQVPQAKRTRVIDYKTGKIYGDNKLQLELYAIAGFAHYPNSEEVSTELWYLDQGEEKKEVYKRSDLPKLQKAWKQRVIPLLSERRFAPKPGDYCVRCAYSKRRNGPCKF